ncbi:TIGR03086 family metal-binding protein [Vallicoccus soli]|uniref:TIGR03086 family protein n=1 Tax=Vallicoccus soli TaxID=2339232 RepID=A0A3A3Z036_9ACTN|nr:TIGR03086 family metal-binding protein [Vallicoccus soli]RJK94812.1 TIGR03086 family protein [Vallicoccus soli]
MENPRTTDRHELVLLGLQAFTDRVAHVPADRWDAPTPCEGWSVRDLVGHLVSEHLWAPYLLEGGTVEEAGDRFDGDLLGDDPARAWDRAEEGSAAAWSAADLDSTVHLSSGDAPAREYADQMLLDLTVHGWDLARGAGLDERLEPRLVRHALRWAQDNEAMVSGSGLFGERQEPASDDPQDQLLALLGRRP